MKSLSLATLFGLLLAIGTVHADISINEMRVDQSGSDTDEFVEFYSASGMNLDGLTFVVLQDNGFIDDAIDLSGNTLAAGGFLLVAENNPLPTSGATPDVVSSLAFENGENAAYIIVDNFTGSTGTDLDADDDGVFDAALPWGTIFDGIALLDDDATILNGGSEDIDYSAALGISTVGPDGTFFPAHVFASADGGGIDSIGGFNDLSGDTPGFSNVAIPEPTSIAILAATSLLAVRRRR